MTKTSIKSMFLAGILLAMPLLGAEPMKVLILPFQVNAGPELHHLKRALSELLSARLTSRQKMMVIDDPRVESIAGDQKSAVGRAAELGKSLGAAWLIVASFTKVGEHVSFDALMIGLSGQSRQKSAVVEGTGMDSVIPKLTELAQSIHTMLVGEPLL